MPMGNPYSRLLHWLPDGLRRKRAYIVGSAFSTPDSDDGPHAQPAMFCDPLAHLDGTPGIAVLGLFLVAAAACWH